MKGGASGLALSRGYVVGVWSEAPAERPVLGPHLVTPSDGAGPIVEVANAQRPAVQKPHHPCPAALKADDGVRPMSVTPPHSQHDRPGVVGDRLRRNFLEPVRRLGRNGNHVAFGQVVYLPALNARSATLIRACLPGIHQGSASYERGLTFNDDEDMVGLLMYFILRRAP